MENIIDSKPVRTVMDALLRETRATARADVFNKVIVELKSCRTYDEAVTRVIALIEREFPNLSEAG